MTNIIEAQKKVNKELLEENENLKKQLADKEENLKLKIWHVTGQSIDSNGECSMYAPKGTWWYKKLNKKWMDEGKLRMAIDPNETREWAKNCKRIYFDNITIEEMLEGFIDYSNELGGSYAGSFSRISNLNSQLIQQKRDYEEELKSQAEEIQQLEEALELEEETSDCHLEALEVAKQWRIRQSKEKDDNLERASRKIEMLENIVAWQKYLSGKQLQELPSLPKKEGKLKLLTNKVKNKVSQVKAITQEKFETYILQKNK